MNTSTHYWFSPAPSEVTSSRVSLDFDLRSADLFFRELVVPELGRIWFARQLSWPVAALALYEELARDGSNPPKPTTICHGIEALACKLEYQEDPDEQDERSRRVLGRRAFGRDIDSEIWTFKQLSQATNYVRNTHRQAATRALRVDGGLGFASGSRFDLLELEPVGRALANAFLEQRVGQGSTTLCNWLKEWICGAKKLPKNPDSYRKAMSPEHCSDKERELVRSRLLETSASEKRQRLADAIGRAEGPPSIEDGVVTSLLQAGYKQQANEIVAARAFGAVLDRARDAVASLTCVVEPQRGGVKLTTLASDSALKKSIKESIKDLRTVSKNYAEKANTAGIKEATSLKFAKAVINGEDADAIRILVQRSGDVLVLCDNSVTRGPLFRVVGATDEANDLEDGASSIEPDRTGRTFRIANLHSLLRDVDQRGAP